MGTQAHLTGVAGARLDTGALSAVTIVDQPDAIDPGAEVVVVIDVPAFRS